MRMERYILSLSLLLTRGDIFCAFIFNNHFTVCVGLPSLVFHFLWLMFTITLNGIIIGLKHTHAYTNNLVHLLFEAHFSAGCLAVW